MRTAKVMKQAFCWGMGAQEQEEKHRDRMLEERRAIQEKEAAARKRVDDGEALKALGNALLKSGDLAGALDKYRQAVSTDPGGSSSLLRASPSMRGPPGLTSLSS